MSNTSTAEDLTVEQMTKNLKFLTEEVSQLIEMIDENQVANYPLSQLQSVLDGILKSSEQCHEVLRKLMFELSEEDGEPFKQKQRKLRKMVFNASTWIMNAIEAKSIQTAQSTTSSTDMSVKLKLPPIVIPKFNGAPEEWIPFRDMYLLMIHENSQLSGSQKFRFLKTSIIDKLSPIKMMLETDEGYEEAWNIVLTYYDNKRKIVDSHFSAILNAKKMTSENYEELQQLINEFSCNIEALQRLVPEEELFEAFTAHLITQRLDANTRDLWESENAEEIPRLSSVKKFLEKRRKVLCTLSRPQAVSKAANVFHVHAMSVEQSNMKCYLCSESHRLMDCPKFLKMEVTARFKFVKEKRLCFNCFSKSHGSKKCRNPQRCRSCDRPHHTLLHYPKRTTMVSNYYGHLPLFIPRNNVKQSQESSISHIAISNGTVLTGVQKTPEPPRSATVLSCFSHAIHDTRIHQRCSLDNADSVKRQGFGEADSKEKNQVRVKSRWKERSPFRAPECVSDETKMKNHDEEKC
jgi:hypothetical protein